MEELKTCPFCGGKAEFDIVKDFDEKIVSVSVMCKNCAAITRSYATKNAAMQAWNKRI